MSFILFYLCLQFINMNIFIIKHLQNEDILYNMNMDFEMLCVDIIPTMLNHMHCLCSYLFGHILLYLLSLIFSNSFEFNQKERGNCPSQTLFLQTHQQGAYFFILIRLMCISEKGRTFDDMLTFNACASGARASFFSAEGFLNGIYFALVYIYFFVAYICNEKKYIYYIYE